MRRLLTGAAQVPVPAVLRIARVYWLLIAVMVAFAVAFATMREMASEQTLLVHKLTNLAGQQTAAVGVAGATLRTLLLAAEGAYPPGRQPFLQEELSRAVQQLSSSYAETLKAEQGLPRILSYEQPSVRMFIENTEQSMSLRDGVAWLLSYLQTIVGTADGSTGAINTKLPDVQGVLLNTAVQGPMHLALLQWLGRLQAMNEAFTQDQLVLEVAVFASAFVLLLVLTAMALSQHVRVAAHSRARSMQALLLLPRAAVRRLSARAAAAITAVLQEEEQNADDRETPVALVVARNLSENASAAGDTRVYSRQQSEHMHDDTWGVPDDLGEGGVGGAMRMLGKPRKHVDTSRFRLRWSLMLLAPLVLLGVWLGSMFSVNVTVAARADDAAHRVELSAEMTSSLLQLQVLALDRSTPGARGRAAGRTMLAVGAQLRLDVSAVSRRLLHGDAQKEPLRAGSQAFSIFAEDACGVLEIVLQGGAFQGGANATCAGVQGGVATRGLALIINKFLQDVQRYIALPTVNGSRGEMLLASLSELAFPMSTAATSGFQTALDSKTASDFEGAHTIAAALTVVFVVAFAAAVLLFFIPKMRQVGTSVQSTRALLVLLAPTLLAADSGSTMSGALTALASEVAAEQTAVSSMAGAGLCGGSQAQPQGASLKLASSSLHTPEEEL
jgi:hypothetical protein